MASQLQAAEAMLSNDAPIEREVARMHAALLNRRSSRLAALPPDAGGKVATGRSRRGASVARVPDMSQRELLRVAAGQGHGAAAGAATRLAAVEAVTRKLDSVAPLPADGTAPANGTGPALEPITGAATAAGASLADDGALAGTSGTGGGHTLTASGRVTANSDPRLALDLSTVRSGGRRAVLDPLKAARVAGKEKQVARNSHRRAASAGRSRRSAAAAAGASAGADAGAGGTTAKQRPFSAAAGRNKASGLPHTAAELAALKRTAGVVRGSHHSYDADEATRILKSLDCTGGMGRAFRTGGVTKALYDVVCDTCAVGLDGGIARPAFLGPTVYEEPKSMEAFFKRSGEGLRVGKPPRAAYVPKAVHSSDDAQQRQPGSAAHRPSAGGFKAGRTAPQFSRAGILGPSADAGYEAPRGSGSALRVGAAPQNPFPRYVNEADRPEKVDSFKPKNVFEHPARFRGADAGNGDFFDAGIWMSENNEPDMLPPPYKLGKAWMPAGDKSRGPVGAYPHHSVDGYGVKPKGRADSRLRGRFCGHYVEGRTAKPVSWDKTRTVDVFRTRNLNAHASGGGWGTQASLAASNPPLGLGMTM